MKRCFLNIFGIVVFLIVGIAVASTWAGHQNERRNLDLRVIDSQELLNEEVYTQVDLTETEAPIVADLPNCVETGQPCTVGGIPCCDSTKSCTGKFPNTYCQ